MNQIYATTLPLSEPCMNAGSSLSVSSGGRPPMLTTLFLNFCVLVSSSYLLSLTFRQGQPEQDALWYRLRLLALAGIGLLVLQFHASLAPGFQADLRAVPFVFALLRYGPRAAIGVGLPMLLFRFLQGGAGAPVMILSFLGMFLVGNLLGRWPALRLKAPHPLQVNNQMVLAAGLTLLPNGLALLLLPGTSALWSRSYLPVLALSLAGAAGLWSIVSSRMRHLELLGRWQQQALLDPLTGIANRRQFERDLASSQPQDALLMLDIDHFKQVNDRHGHAAGDQVLCAAAQALSNELRGDDRVYRLGGEEFAVLLNGVSELQAQAVAERLRSLIAEQPLGGVPISISLGLSLRGNDAPQQTLEQADAALYRAKAAGRNCVRIWAAGRAEQGAQLTEAALIELPTPSAPGCRLVDFRVFEMKR